MHRCMCVEIKGHDHCQDFSICLCDGIYFLRWASITGIFLKLFLKCKFQERQSFKSDNFQVKYSNKVDHVYKVWINERNLCVVY